MKIERRFLSPHTRAAAVDQVAANMRALGYEVSRETPLRVGERELRFDLEATRGTERQFYEFRVPGEARSKDRTLNDLAQAARASGGRFNLIVVRPERGVDVQVDGLDAALAAALEDDPTGELGALGARVEIDAVSSIEIARIVRHDGGAIDVSGSAVVEIIQYGSDEGEFEVARSEFPFDFQVRLDAASEIAAEPPPVFEIDLTSWYGDDSALTSPVEPRVGDEHSEF